MYMHRPQSITITRRMNTNIMIIVRRRNRYNILIRNSLHLPDKKQIELVHCTVGLHQAHVGQIVVLPRRKRSAERKHQRHKCSQLERSIIYHKIQISLEILKNIFAYIVNLRKQRRRDRERNNYHCEDINARREFRCRISKLGQNRNKSHFHIFVGSNRGQAVVVYFFFRLFNF